MPPYLLGKKPPRFDIRTLEFGDYLTPQLPKPPDVIHWGDKFKDWGMMLNDAMGTCVEAGCGHWIQSATFNATGNAVTVKDSDILTAYEDVGGYDPSQAQPDGSNPTDNGTDMLSMLNYWRHVGVGNHKIGAFASIEPGSREYIKDGLWMYGGLYIGLSLPLTARTQVLNNKKWSLVPDWQTNDNARPYSWGGHCVAVLNYDRYGLNCVTWGMLQRMTWMFWQTYCDEAYVLIGEDWLNGKRVTPSGFDMQTLQNDLNLITN